MNMEKDVKLAEVNQLPGNYFSVIIKRDGRQEGRIGVSRVNLARVLTGEQCDEMIVVPESSEVGNVMRYRVGARR